MALALACCQTELRAQANGSGANGSGAKAASSPFAGRATADWFQVAQAPAKERLRSVSEAQPDGIRFPAQGGAPAAGDQPPVPGGPLEEAAEGAEEGVIDDHSTLWDRQSPAVTADCCKGCPSFWYFQPDAFFVKRNQPDRTQIAQSLFLPNFDYHTGMRLTIGRQADCLEAIEFVYTGVNNWEAANTVNGPGLQSLFAQGAGVFNLDDFDNALSQTAINETNLNSFELNRRRWGWDIISTVVGLRYINLEDQLFFSSTANPPTSVGQYNIRANNNLFGFQIGGDLLYPLGPGFNIAINGKFGAFANNASQQTVIINNGATVISNSASELDYSLLAQFGGYMTYRIRPRATLKAGYEYWYWYRNAQAPNQMDFAVSSQLGNQLNSDSTLILTAFTTGLEFQW